MPWSGRSRRDRLHRRSTAAGRHKPFRRLGLDFLPREPLLVSEGIYALVVNDQVVTLPTPERVSALHFEELSDSIAMTRQMLEETADTYGLLDNQHRELELLLSSGK